MMKLTVMLWVMFAVFLGSHQVEAGEVRIVDAVARTEIGFFSDSYLFEVSLEHADEGPEHYADRWEVWTPDGKTLLETRVLRHPHVEEQPVTRSLSGVDIPEGVKQVVIRAHDTKHGDSPNTLLVTLPEPK